MVAAAATANPVIDVGEAARSASEASAEHVRKATRGIVGFVTAAPRSAKRAVLFAGRKVREGVIWVAPRFLMLLGIIVASALVAGFIAANVLLVSWFFSVSLFLGWAAIAVYTVNILGLVLAMIKSSVGG